MQIVHCSHPVNLVIKKIEAFLHDKQVKIFGIYDHSTEASMVSLSLPDTQVIVFGDPKVGTLLMQADNRVALQLPLKVVVWQAGDRTCIGYDKPSLLANTYDLSNHTAVLANMDQFMENLVAAANQ